MKYTRCHPWMKNCTRIALFNPIQIYSTISDFASIVYTGSNTIAEESLKNVRVGKY